MLSKKRTDKFTTEILITRNSANPSFAETTGIISLNRITKIVKSIIVLLFIGCAPALYVPTTENAIEGTNLEELKQGRILYVSNCGSCHNLHLPEEFIREVWEKQLEEMQVKANISDRDRALILNYLVSKKDYQSSRGN